MSSSWIDVEREHVRNVLRASTVSTSAMLPEVEYALIRHLSPLIPERVAVDVGAFRGSYTHVFREEGFKVFTFEPVPSRVSDLRKKWAKDPDVHIKRVACSNEDGLADIHLGTWELPQQQDLNPGDMFNTLERRPKNSVLSFPAQLSVVRRRLAWFVEHQIIPEKIGILKVDTEGHDVAVLEGAWPHLGRVNLCEYWNEAFLFNASNTRNDLSDYEDFFASRADVYTLVIGRDAENPAMFYQVNPRGTSRNSWGNILFTEDLNIFARAVDWCANVIGCEAARG